MIVSFISNSRGLTYLQIQSFHATLDEYSDITEFNHGGDRQDEKIHEIVSKLNNVKINIYPLISNKSELKHLNAEYFSPTNVSVRNRTLVDRADLIIAAPMLVFEFEDSAAWRTINYAISKDKDIVILSTKGTIFTVWKNLRKEPNASN